MNEPLDPRDALELCQCGTPSIAYQAIVEVLRWAATPHMQRDLNWPHSDHMRYAVIYFMDAAGLLEHGGSIGGSWLSESGSRVLAWFDKHGLNDETWPDPLDAVENP